MKFTIDLEAAESKEELHALLAESLPLPDYYGYNLDALYDVLTDGHAMWEIRFENSSECADNLGDYFESFRETVEDAVAQGAALRVEWAG